MMNQWRFFFLYVGDLDIMSADYDKGIYWSFILVGILLLWGLYYFAVPIWSADFSKASFWFLQLFHTCVERLTLTTMGLLEQPQILGGGGTSFACSICAILIKLWEIEQIDKYGAITYKVSELKYLLFVFCDVRMTF